MILSRVPQETDSPSQSLQKGLFTAVCTGERELIKDGATPTEEVVLPLGLKGLVGRELGKYSDLPVFPPEDKGAGKVDCKSAPQGTDHPGER